MEFHNLALLQVHDLALLLTGGLVGFAAGLTVGQDWFWHRIFTAIARLEGAARRRGIIPDRRHRRELMAYPWNRRKS